MRRLLVGLAVGALLAGGAGEVARAQTAVSGPAISLATTELQPGERVLVTLTGWTSRNVVLSVCGNLARRGSEDCNLSASYALKLVSPTAPTMTELVVGPPPGTCPCVIRGSTAGRAEQAVVPIDLVGWPVGPIQESVFNALISVSIDVRRAERGFVGLLRASLAGRTDYVVVTTLRNLTTESLPGIALSGSAGRSSNGQDVSFDVPAPQTLTPGQSWEQEVRVTLPAPVFKAFTWRVIASGAGPPASAETGTRSVPIGFVVVVSVLVGAVVAMLCRMARRRRTRRREDGRRRRSGVVPRAESHRHRRFARRSPALKEAATIGS